MPELTADISALIPHSKLSELRVKAHRNGMELSKLIESLIDAYLTSGSYDLASLQEFSSQILIAIKTESKESKERFESAKSSIKSLFEFRSKSDIEIDKLQKQLEKLETKVDSKLKSGRGSGRKKPNAQVPDIDPKLTPEQLIGREYRLCQWDRYLGLQPGQVGSRIGKAKLKGIQGALVRGHLLVHCGMGLARLENIVRLPLIDDIEYGKNNSNAVSEPILADSQS